MKTFGLIGNILAFLLTIGTFWHFNPFENGSWQDWSVFTAIILLLSANIRNHIKFSDSESDIVFPFKYLFLYLKRKSAEEQVKTLEAQKKISDLQNAK